MSQQWTVPPPKIPLSDEGNGILIAVDREFGMDECSEVRGKVVRRKDEQGS